MATSWTDPTLTGGATVGSTPVTAAHIAQLRSALAAERSRRSLSAVSWTDPSIAAGSPYHVVNMTEVRGNITNFTALSVTDSTLTAGTSPAKAVHISEIRTKINALEAHSFAGGATDCNSGCTGLCVNACTACTGCTSCTSCTGGCSSCSGCSGCTGGCFSTCDYMCYWYCSGACEGACLHSCSGG